MRTTPPTLAALCLLALLPCAAPAAPHAPSARRACAARVWPAVRRGDEDAANFRVTIVQRLLRTHALTVPVDGRFGPQTQQAVRRYQKSRGLPVTGVVANRTWEALIVRLTDGSGGDAVRAAQTVLHEVGETRVAMDGRFGAQTARAVREFQKTSGLTVDGVVGPETWLALTGDFFD